MRTAVSGMPRIGRARELKWALEDYWAGRIDSDALLATAAEVRRWNWETLRDAGIDFVPCNDFSLYDHVLDAAVAVGAIPERFASEDRAGDLGVYFAMARGGDLGAGPVPALDLTKWFDTNYHHLVPEIGPAMTFRADPTKACGELEESAALGVTTVPGLVGPFTLLSRSAPAVEGFDVLGSLGSLGEAYAEQLVELARHGAAWVRLDEPALTEDRDDRELAAVRKVYERLASVSERPRLLLSTYFGHVGDSIHALRELPVEGIGLDFCYGSGNSRLLERTGGLADKVLFAGVVDGRNVWANDLDASLRLLDRLSSLCGELVVSTSCSLIHVPVSLAAEAQLDVRVRPWLAFGEEKIAEIAVLARGAEEGRGAISAELEANRAVLEARRRSPLASDPVLRRTVADTPPDPRRDSWHKRAAAQQARMGLPPLPITVIGSFPQTHHLRSVRAGWRAGRVSDRDYETSVRSEIDRVIALQERLGMDVVVHGEPERDDMVRYFAARLDGFALTENGWVQSYGSRCVRPPILYGEVRRPQPISVEWASYAQSRSARPVKGMLTGPVTMLRWSFVRDDLPESETAAQLALAMREELLDLQQAGIAVVQVDEPALREGMPLRRAEQPGYLEWAARVFRLVTSAADTDTQVHTHMCYARVEDIVDVLEELDVDVVSMEAARSKMQLLEPLGSARYQGGLGPGVYDVHSPIVPDVTEIEDLLHRALQVVDSSRLWVNPDCGLKTRRYDQVEPSLVHMVSAALRVRSQLG